MSRPLRTYLNPSSLVNVIGVPKKMAGMSLDDFEVDSEAREKVKDFAVEYVENMDSYFDEGKGIYFYGSNGVGKTFLACIILKEAYRRRYECKRVTFMDYCSVYTRVWDAGNLSERESLEEKLYTNYKATEFLLLEEIGKGVENSTTIPILEDLLRYREDKGLVTIFCTNIHPNKIKELYGNSVYSLITGNSIPVMMEDRDRRRD